MDWLPYNQGMPSQLTVYAEQVKTRALAEAMRAGRELAGPFDLLLCLPARADSSAGRILGRLGVTLADIHVDRPEAATQPTTRAFFGQAAADAIAAAYTEAERLGDAHVGTEHLLLGLFATRPNDAALFLEERCVDESRVRGAVEKLREDEATGVEPLRPDGDLIPTRDGSWLGGRPFPVQALMIAMVLQLFCCGPWPALTYFGRYSYSVYGDASLGMLAYGLSLLWTLALCVLLIRPLLRRRQWAWAAATTVLFVQCAVTAATAVLVPLQMLTTSGGHGGPTGAGWLSLYGFGSMLVPLLVRAALLAGIFSVRGWYGIRRREGWTVMLRQGWWALAVTALLSMASLLAAIIRSDSSW
jgi:hypothetical protein